MLPALCVCPDFKSKFIFLLSIDKKFYKLETYERWDIMRYTQLRAFDAVAREGG